MGVEPLFMASFEGHSKVVEILISKGVDANIIDDIGWTALHVASIQGHTKIIKLLIEHGIDINIKDKNGHTAEDLTNNEEIRELIKTKLQKTLFEIQKVLINKTRIFDIITQFTKLINIKYLISLQRR